jgi:hypothetical protein
MHDKSNGLNIKCSLTDEFVLAASWNLCPALLCKLDAKFEKAVSNDQTFASAKFTAAFCCPNRVQAN